MKTDETNETIMVLECIKAHRQLKDEFFNEVQRMFFHEFTPGSENNVQAVSDILKNKYAKNTRFIDPIYSCLLEHALFWVNWDYVASSLIRMAIDDLKIKEES